MRLVNCPAIANLDIDGDEWSIDISVGTELTVTLQPKDLARADAILFFQGASSDPRCITLDTKDGVRDFKQAVLSVARLRLREDRTEPFRVTIDGEVVLSDSNDPRKYTLKDLQQVRVRGRPTMEVKKLSIWGE